MKRMILFFVVLVVFFPNCTKSDPSEPQKLKQEESVVQPQLEPHILSATFDVKIDKELDGVIYPAFIFNEKDNYTLIDKISGQLSKKANIKIVIEENKLMGEKIIFQNNVSSFSFKPQHIWKLNDFKSITTAGNINLAIAFYDNDTNKLLDKKNFNIPYRPINESVYAIKEKNSDRFLDYRNHFAAYVNEDSPLIESFLKEVEDFWKDLKSGETHNGYEDSYNFQGWVGYQYGDSYLSAELNYIVLYLFSKGYEYSSITTTSNYSVKVASQYVRFIDNSILNKRANCVDGTVLLASILERIGIRCFLVLEPGHMYLACSKTGKLKPNIDDLVFIETTLISTGKLYPWVDEKDRIRDGVFDYLKKDISQLEFIGIREARARGIKPIQ
jgi:hypothetical protein